MLCNLLKLEHLWKAKFQHFMFFLPLFAASKAKLSFTLLAKCSPYLPLSPNLSHKLSENIDPCPEEHCVKIENTKKWKEAIIKSREQHEDPPAKISFTFLHSGSLKTQGTTCLFLPKPIFKS